MSREEFAAVYERHYAGLVRRLTLMMRDLEDAEDVAQETSERGFAAWDKFDGRDERAWLYTIAIRLALNRIRSRSRLLRALSRMGAREPTWVPAEYIDLWRALDELHPEHRGALLLNVVDGYTQEEIGRIFNRPPGTIAGWIAASKRQLHTALSDKGGSR